MSDFSSLPYRPCAGIMLTNNTGQIFVGERIDMPGAWQMPQGGIDEGETHDAAALRELEEEIGVRARHVDVLASTADWVYYDLPPHLLGKVWRGRYRGQKQKWFLMRLKTGDNAINIQTKHPEFRRWKWTDPDSLLSEIVPFKRPVYEKVLSELLP
ncbi:RNA pyrophosphohydrolase [Kordiimonas aestuarii]|uniref:RNA pyrophosphohydrolase n=1 Tax=Kordiimonas aestuarii TaxID=1005925 RepID=UPI0021D1237D|nr:RNA pyrophosphohydrolase [Kordiimonas aestuarii]